MDGVLTTAFDMSQPAISKHLRVLERAGLIEQSRQAQWRPRRLLAGPLRDISDWVGQYRRHWEESFDRLDAYLRDVQSRQEQDKGDDDERDTIDRGSTDTTNDEGRRNGSASGRQVAIRQQRPGSRRHRVLRGVSRDRAAGAHEVDVHVRQSRASDPRVDRRR